MIEMARRGISKIHVVYVGILFQDLQLVMTGCRDHRGKPESEDPFACTGDAAEISRWLKKASLEAEFAEARNCHQPMVQRVKAYCAEAATAGRLGHGSKT